MFVRDLVTVEPLEVRQGHSSVLDGSGALVGAPYYRLRSAGSANGTTITRFRAGLMLEGNGGTSSQLQWRTEADVARPGRHRYPQQSTPLFLILTAPTAGSRWA